MASYMYSVYIWLSSWFAGLWLVTGRILRIYGSEGHNHPTSLLTAAAATLGLETNASLGFGLKPDAMTGSKGPPRCMYLHNDYTSSTAKTVGFMTCRGESRQ
ncbi:uncharacterized protein MCYG_03584 [Microsporum canis CBS 113480]|uniref:Uncharacterized protein n=1 Tax=Arthroderma otae (strain ATCC MYA-4605 / CBS 113480) TaxID=554155 RepID=C5FM43_ARTOC|nr:uncharacterized protein MCYG_03584 [Microsporum canis CBS 113480]EEQ30765.1 predicted protein [Microsporum canis CBS 113480]